MNESWYNYLWKPVKPAGEGRFIFDWNEVEEPGKIRTPSVILLSGDIFDFPKSWIPLILDTINETPQHIYVILTKQPERYHNFDFSLNVYLGVIIDSARDLKKTETLKDLPNRKLVSISPLSDDPALVNITMFDWIVSGDTLYKKEIVND